MHSPAVADKDPQFVIFLYVFWLLQETGRYKSCSKFVKCIIEVVNWLVCLNDEHNDEQDLATIDVEMLCTHICRCLRQQHLNISKTVTIY